VKSFEAQGFQVFRTFIIEKPILQCFLSVLKTRGQKQKLLCE